MIQRAIFILLLGLVLTQSLVAQADTGTIATLEASPPTGKGGIIFGWAVLGLGATELALLPVCHADFYPARAEDACVIATGVYVAGALVASITGLAIGYTRRARYRAWQARHNGAQLLPNVQLGAAHGSLLFGLRTTF